MFHDQYEVVRRIDSGAMGTVYEVLDRVTRRRRALKVMLTRFVDNNDVTERFRREATITADVVSEHVVETFDAGVDAASGLPFIVMELLRGEDLGKVIARGPLPGADVVALLMQASSALDRMHAHGIVHRDLKPENLFITRRDDGSPRLKVLDFGIAKVVEKAAPSATSTRNMGTPVYMSPEQVLGAGNVGPPADLYAVGHLAYTMLTGQPYWLEDALSFESVYPLLLRIMDGAIEPASERAMRNKQVTLSPAFDAWFSKATAHAPEDRFKSATASIFALADALDVARPMLLSWPMDPVAAAAPTLQPPANDAPPGEGDHRESAAILLLPRPAPTPRTGPVLGIPTADDAPHDAPEQPIPHADEPVRGDASTHPHPPPEISAPPAAEEHAPAAPDSHGRKHEALRTLSPVSTLPGSPADHPPKSAHPSRHRALIAFGAAFFLAGVLGAVFLARGLRGSLPPAAAQVASTDPSTTLAAPPPTVEPSPSATAPAPDLPAPSDSGEPRSAPTATTTTATPSAAPTSRPTGKGRVPGPRKASSTSKTATPPAAPTGTYDPRREL